MRPARALPTALFAIAFGTNVPTPLLLIYREQLDLSATTLTVLFAVYAAGLVPTLFVAGPASDRFGRRAVVVPFAVLSLLASGLYLLAADSLPLLMVGRLLQGMVSGAVFSVASAWIGEIEPDPGRAARLATSALSLGFGVGPLASGLLGQYVAAPLATPYVVHMVLVAVGLALLRTVPETHLDRRGDGPLLNLGIPRGARAPFAAFALPAALCSFSFPTIAITVLPLQLQQSMPGRDVAVTGAVAGITMVTGVFVQRVEKRLGATTAAPLGAAAGLGGVLTGLAGTALDAPLLLAPTALLLGTAYGLTLAAGLTATQMLAAPAERGAMVATFYALTYVGFAAPVILAAVSDGTDFTGGLIGMAVLAGAVTALLQAGPGRRLLHAAGYRRPPRVPAAA